MSNSFYNVSGTPGTQSSGKSSPMRAEFAAIAAGFDLLPMFSPTTAGQIVVVNAGGTGFTTSSLASLLTSPPPIGSVAPASGAFTTLSASGNATVGGQLTVAGAFSAGATNLTSLGVTGNATVNGTLGVVGGTTLGTLGAGATALASLGVIGNTAVGGTLGVTGAATFSAGLTGTLTGHASLDLPLTGGTVTGATTFSGGLTGTLTGHASLDLPLTGGTLSGVLGVGGAGITFPGLGGYWGSHHIGLGWDGTYLQMAVDGGGVGAIAPIAYVNGTFLPLAGGTVTGNLEVNGVTNFGTSGQFYTDPTALTLNFASGNYIGYNPGFPGILIQSTTDISIKPGAAYGLFVYGAIYPSTDGLYTLGSGGARWQTVYASSGTINTSDANEKQDIADLPAALLDAWDTMHVRTFRFRSAAAEKGSAARRHTGYVAQEFAVALQQQKVIPAEWGAWCNDVLAQGGERQSLRYDELFAIADAAHRRRMDRQAARLDALEARR